MPAPVQELQHEPAGRDIRALELIDILRRLTEASRTTIGDYRCHADARQALAELDSGGRII